jgi:hypothetical protein
MNDRKYCYSREDAVRIIEEAVAKHGKNEATNPLGYIGGPFGKRVMFAFAEHHKPFWKGRFRKVGFTL